jgi:hypothetical protein
VRQRYIHALSLQMSRNSLEIFSIVEDGTKGLVGLRLKDHMSVCKRYVDAALAAHEDFVGFNEHACIHGNNYSTTSGFRQDFAFGQAYDSGSNMDGIYSMIFERSYGVAILWHCTVVLSLCSLQYHVVNTTWWRSTQ